MSYSVKTSITGSITKENVITPAVCEGKHSIAVLVPLDISRTPEANSATRNKNKFTITDAVSVSSSSLSLRTALSQTESRKETPLKFITIGRAMKDVIKEAEEAPSAIATVTPYKSLLPNIVSPTPSRKSKMMKTTASSAPRHSPSSSLSSSSLLSLCSSSRILQKNQQIKPKGQIFKMVPKEIKAMLLTKSSLPKKNQVTCAATLSVKKNSKQNGEKIEVDSKMKTSPKEGAILESSDKMNWIDNQDELTVCPSSTDMISPQTLPSTKPPLPKKEQYYQPVTVQHDYHDHANDPPLFLLYDYHHQHQHDDYYLKEEINTVNVEEREMHNGDETNSNVVGDHVVDELKFHDGDHDNYSKFHQDLRQRSVTIKRSTSSQQPFPMKLYDILEIIMTENKYTNVISWQPHGRCFVIHDHVLFKSIILPEYFKLNIMASFQRQLNLYGFKRITQSTSKDKNGYYHEYFLRGRYDLLYGIHRIKIKGTGIRAKSNPLQEPKFWNNFPWITKRPCQSTSTTTSSPILPLKAMSTTTSSVIALSTMDNHGTVTGNGDKSIEVVDDSNHLDHPITLEESNTTAEVITVHHDGDDDVSPTPMDLDESRENYIHPMTSNNSFSQQCASSIWHCDNDRHDAVQYGGNGDANKSTKNDVIDQQLGNQPMDLSEGMAFLDYDIDDMIPLSISIFNDIRDEKDMETYLSSSISHVVSPLPSLSTALKPTKAFPYVVTPLTKTYYVSNDSISDSNTMESNLELNDIINKRCYLQQRCPSPMNNDNCYNAENIGDDLYSITSTDDYFIPCRPTNHSSDDVIVLGWGKPFHFLNYFYEKMVPPNTETSINDNNCLMHGASSTNLISIHDIRDDF